MRRKQRPDRLLIVLVQVVIILCFCTLIYADNERDFLSKLNDRVIPLNDEESLDKLLQEAADNRLVLLGESTHGTSEYYIWRSRISKRLIEEHGFDFIVVEGDWPSFYIINQKVKGLDYEGTSFRDLFVSHFNRWPHWMWANEETLKLAEWLAKYNEDKSSSEKAGIYGMDVYSKKESIKEVQEYLNSFGIEHYTNKANLLNCFERYGFDGSNYARAIHSGASGCADKVLRVVNFLREESQELSEHSEKDYFNAKHNALIVKNAEKHYRTAIRQDSDSWNYRAYHFYLTAQRLLDYYGENSKGIVWAHNTHIGDARATSMLQQGSHNIGQLARENLGRENVFLIGFGCNEGSVIAGSRWEAPRQIMKMPAAGEGTIERVLNRIDIPDYYFLMDDELRNHPFLRRYIGHRAVGVVYNPAVEYPGNYVPTVLGERYDAFIYITETNHLRPLHR